jgi:hypothetical protein
MDFFRKWRFTTSSSTSSSVTSGSPDDMDEMIDPVLLAVKDEPVDVEGVDSGREDERCISAISEMVRTASSLFGLDFAIWLSTSASLRRKCAISNLKAAATAAGFAMDWGLDFHSRSSIVFKLF